MFAYSSLLFVHGDLFVSGARNLFVLYRDWHILSGSFCPQVVADASAYAGQVRLLCACMLACLRIAFYDVYTALFFSDQPGTARMLGCIQ